MGSLEPVEGLKVVLDDSSKRVVKAVVVCRYRDNVVAELPCNFVARGFCGVDGKLCDILVLEVVSSG